MSERASKKGRASARPETVPANGLEDLNEPIAALTWLMRETAARALEMEDFAALVGFMEKYSMASTRLANLLKAQRKLDGDQGMNEALQQALDSVVEEMSARTTK